MRCPPTQGTQGSRCSVTSQQDGVVPRRKLEMLMPSRQPTIVLVHGAFANTSTWSKRTPLVIERGCSVVAVHCPLSSLADYVVAVERVIGMQDAPVLLVGHSWGGAIITEAGNDAKVRGLVYISAGAPDSNQSFNEWWEGYPSAPGAAEIEPYGTDRMALTLDGFRQFFAQDLGTDEIELLYCLQGPYASSANDEK